MSGNDVPIGQGHTFTVLDTTASGDDIVEVGDKQTWRPDVSLESGKLSVEREGKPVVFWDDKLFGRDRLDDNRYIAYYDEGGSTFSITLVFERARHMSMHKDVWFLFGARSEIRGEHGCGVRGGPPDWGGQNLQ